MEQQSTDESNKGKATGNTGADSRIENGSESYVMRKTDESVSAAPTEIQPQPIDPAGRSTQIEAPIVEMKIESSTLIEPSTVANDHTPTSIDARNGTLHEATRPGQKAGTVNQVIADRYEVVRHIGEGGMGVVYEARDSLIGFKPVALKMLLTRAAPSGDAIRRFQREAELMAEVNHPHIVGIRNFGITKEGHIYLVMDLVLGNSLASTIAHNMSIADPNKERAIKFTVDIAVQICDALMHATPEHNVKLQHVIVHRDLKPSNIMISWKETNEFGAAGYPHATILDFGLAKVFEDERQSVTATGVACGSPTYMSPEQCKGAKLDQRSDVYSLGCVIFESITGVPPFVAENQLNVMRKHIDEPAPTLREATLGLPIPEELERIVAKTLQKAPGDRYQTAEELKHDLIEFQANFHSSTGSPNSKTIKRDLGQPNSSAPSVAKIRKGSISNKAKITAAIFSAALGLLVAGYCSLQSPQHLHVPEELNIRDTKYGSKIVAPLSVSGISNIPGKKTADVASLEQNTLPEDVLSIKPDANERSGDAWVRKQMDDGTLPDPLILSAKDKTVGGTNFTEVGLKYLSASHVHSLNLQGTNITDGGLKYLEHLRLNSLDISDTAISDVGVEHLARIGSLKQIILNRTNVTDAGIEALEPLKDIEDLSLDYDNNITDSLMSHLRQFPKLSYLSLRHTKVTNKGVEELPSAAPRLLNLYLEGDEVYDQAILPISKLRSLIVLELSQTRISGKTLQALAALPELRYLDLSKDSFSQENLLHLLRLRPKFFWLYLTGDKIGDGAMPAIASIRGIKWLDLCNSEVTDFGLLALKNSNTLRQVAVSGARVSVSGLQSFSNNAKHIQVLPTIRRASIGAGL